MKDLSLNDVTRLVEAMRKRGVLSFEVGGLKVEFFPSAPDADTPLAPPKLEDNTPLCGCGHAEWSHQNGLCIYGCDIEKCMTEEKQES